MCQCFVPKSQSRQIATWERHSVINYPSLELLTHIWWWVYNNNWPILHNEALMISFILLICIKQDISAAANEEWGGSTYREHSVCVKHQKSLPVGGWDLFQTKSSSTAEINSADRDVVCAELWSRGSPGEQSSLHAWTSCGSYFLTVSSLMANTKERGLTWRGRFSWTLENLLSLLFVARWSFSEWFYQPLSIKVIGWKAFVNFDVSGY